MRLYGAGEPPSPAGLEESGAGPGAEDVRTDPGSGPGGMHRGRSLVAERGPRLPLPSCAREEEERPWRGGGGEHWRRGRAPSGAGAAGRTRGFQLRAVLLSPGTGKFMLLTSTFGARATARSEERAPLHQAKSLARAPWALFWPVSSGVSSSLSVTRDESAFGVPPS